MVSLIRWNNIINISRVKIKLWSVRREATSEERVMVRRDSYNCIYFSGAFNQETEKCINNIQYVDMYVDHVHHCKTPMEFQHQGSFKGKE